MVITVILLTPALSLAQETATDQDVIMFRGFQKGQKDESASVTFKAPPGHIESPSIAKKNGLFKYYALPPSEEGKSPLSIVTVAFKKKSSKPGLRNLDDFISTDISYFRDHYKNATVSQASLPKDVTTHLSEDGIPFETYLTKGNVKGEGKQFLGDGMVLFFETPGGFWSVSWTAPEKLIKEAPDSFLFFLKDMRVNLKSKKPAS